MIIGVTKESLENENRVALDPGAHQQSAEAGGSRGVRSGAARTGAHRARPHR